MPYSAQFAVSAQHDVRAIHAHIAENDSVKSADYVAREIVRAALTLRDLPDRGAHPQELLAEGSRKYRQIFFKPYRIVYRVRANAVIIYLIADGRRDMTSLLVRRLKRS